MTAINTFRPHLSRAAMLLVSAAALLLVAAPKAGAWAAQTDDGFTVSKTYSYSGWSDVTVTGYSGSSNDITLPTTVTYANEEYTVTCIGTNALKNFKNSDVSLKVTIPDTYTSIDTEAFQYCKGLTEITIPGSMTNIGYQAFAGCTGLSSVTFSEGTASLKFGSKPFMNCTSLTSLTIPARTSDISSGIVEGCTNLTSLSVEGGSNAFYAQDNSLYAVSDDNGSYSLITYAPGSDATSFTVPDAVNGKPVTKIGNGAFQNNAVLQNVTIPASVTYFDSNCFNGCSALSKVSLGTTEVPTLKSGCFTGLSSGSVIEVASEDVKNAFEAPDKYTTYYTADNTTVKIKSSDPEPEATPAASLTVKGTGVKDGYSYYKVTLDNSANITTMIVNLSFDASQISMKALANGKKDAYAKLNDSRFVLTPNWKEENGKVKVSLLLTTGNNAVTSEVSSNLLLLALPVKANITGNIAMTVDSAECGGVVSGNSIKNTVTVNGSASNRITSYDVNADDTIDILDITEAQRFYQADSSDSDWADAQKADVNGDGKIDIQDLIDIFLQIEF
ncbi:leucine-rich repeat protein [Agathobaculum hominis]